MSEVPLEDHLNRMFSSWTNDEVRILMETLREVPNHHRDVTWDVVWREYARRSFADNVVCKRCGSDNHTAINHERWVD